MWSIAHESRKIGEYPGSLRMESLDYRETWSLVLDQGGRESLDLFDWCFCHTGVSGLGGGGLLEELEPLEAVVVLRFWKIRPMCSSRRSPSLNKENS